jgi:hypothetical protein
MRPSPAARALRSAAVVGLVASVGGLALEMAWMRAWESLQADGVPFVDVEAKLDLLSACSVGLHAAGVLAIMAFASTWARAGDRRSVLAWVGMGALALHLAAVAYQQSVVLTNASTDELLGLQTWHRVRMVLFDVGMIATLASTRGPIWRAPLYGLALAGWFAAAVSGLELEPWLSNTITCALELVWVVAIAMAARGYPPAAETTSTVGASPAQRRAADGLRLVRTGLAARIAIVLVGVVAGAAMRDSAGLGALVWLLAFAGIATAIAVGTGLARYRELPAMGVESGLVATAIAILVIGAVLDLVAAWATAQLLDWNAKAQAATTMWNMPSLKEAERTQSIAQWSGRIASALGLATMLALATSLHTTAEWCKDTEAATLARRIMLVTLLAAVVGVVALVLATDAQRGEVRTLLLVACAMLGLGVWLLVAWMRLLGRLAGALDP